MKIPNEKLLKMALKRLWTDRLISDSDERQVSGISCGGVIYMHCLAADGSHERMYKCGRVDAATGEYIVTECDDIDLTAPYQGVDCDEYIDPIASYAMEDDDIAPGLQGSPKQIAWATDIIRDVDLIIDEVIWELHKHLDDERAAERIAFYRARREALKRATRAHDIIDLFRDIHYTGKRRKDIPALDYLYRKETAHSAGAAELLGRGTK